MKFYHSCDLNWQTTSVQRAPVIRERRCRECGRGQSEMYDFAKKELVWVPGIFSDSTPDCIYIFASSPRSAQEAEEYLRQEVELAHVHEYVYILDSANQTWERLSNEKWPIFYLAHDWYESPVITDYRFRTLLGTGRADW